MSHAGDLDPQRTWEQLAADSRAALVDVRTRAEWTFVGVPDVSGLDKQLRTIEWSSWPDGRPNVAFVDQLEQSGIERDTPVYFICRSGARSAAAASAATAAGYTQAYNVSEGFEGEVGPDGHRDVSGWRHAGLPWWQG